MERRPISLMPVIHYSIVIAIEIATNLLCSKRYGEFTFFISPSLLDHDLKSHHVHPLIKDEPAYSRNTSRADLLLTDIFK